jgi:hypothetical protein
MFNPIVEVAVFRLLAARPRCGIRQCFHGLIDCEAGRLLAGRKKVISVVPTDINAGGLVDHEVGLHALAAHGEPSSSCFFAAEGCATSIRKKAALSVV